MRASWQIVMAALPSVALNQSRPITSGLRFTLRHRKTLLGVTLLTFGFTVAITAIGDLIRRFVPIPSLGDAFTQFALVSFNVALLTVLYQQFVEAT